MFKRFGDLLQRLWARLSWTGGVHYLNGGPGLPPPLTPEEEKALLARMADGDPAALMPFGNGSILPSTVKAVKKGTCGSAGELRGNFDLTEELGQINDYMGSIRPVVKTRIETEKLRRQVYQTILARLLAEKKTSLLPEELEQILIQENRMKE